MYNIVFDTWKRSEWYRNICYAIEHVHNNEHCQINISDTIKTKYLHPVHIVTLACLIHHLKKRAVDVSMVDNNNGYWIKDKYRLFDVIEDKSETVVDGDKISNLWRVKSDRVEGYAESLVRNLKIKHFPNKDLSAVTLSLLEGYYNIFDHAMADGNAYSMVQYDEDEEKLYVAICDFGQGIPTSVRAKIPDIGSDRDAMAKAMEDCFTVGSKNHNKGMGLGNIKDACYKKDSLKIFSNRGLVMAQRSNVEFFETGFNFPGTLIYYDLTFSNFEDEENLINFAF